MTAQQKREPTNPIAKRLERVRVERGYATLKDFVAALEWNEDFHVNYVTARRYHGDREATAKYLARVAEVFGYRMEWLATGEGPEKMTLAGRVALEAEKGGARWLGESPVGPWVEEVGGVETAEVFRALVERIAQLDPDFVSSARPEVRGELANRLDALLREIHHLLGPRLIHGREMPQERNAALALLTGFLVAVAGPGKGHSIETILERLPQIPRWKPQKEEESDSE